MAMVMGRAFGLLVAAYALTACGDTDKNGSDSDGTGGTGGLGTGGLGAGGTEPQGQGGTELQGQGGTVPQGQGGATSQGQGGTDPQGQGGTVGEAGSSATGGSAGFAGAPAGGAGGAPPSCDGQCEPCAEGYVLVECGERCVCEPADDPLKPTYDDLLACDLDDPCPPSVRHTDPGSSTWTQGACLLAAFRDRTPGIYQHMTTLADLGTYTTNYTFLIGDDDEVLMLRKTENGLASGNLDRTYFPVWSCTLKSYDDLDACVAAGTDVSPSTTGGGTAVCDATEDWFETCETVENPACPGE